MKDANPKTQADRVHSTPRLNTPPDQSRRGFLSRDAGQTATPEPRLERAFLEIESSLRDLPRIARLADEQLHRAIGELAFNGSEYTEIPNFAETELAIFAVSQVAQMAKDLEGLYERLYNECA